MSANFIFRGVTIAALGAGLVFAAAAPASAHPYWGGYRYGWYHTPVYAWDYGWRPHYRSVYRYGVYPYPPVVYVAPPVIYAY
jgi:hypothetical protein